VAKRLHDLFFSDNLRASGLLAYSFKRRATFICFIILRCMVTAHAIKKKFWVLLVAAGEK